MRVAVVCAKSRPYPLPARAGLLCSGVGEAALAARTEVSFSLRQRRRTVAVKLDVNASGAAFVVSSISVRTTRPAASQSC